MFTELKENTTLIKSFGPMLIDFDGYLPYSDEISIFFRTNVNDNIHCDNGYAYYSSKYKTCSWINEEIWEIIQKYILMLSK